MNYDDLLPCPFCGSTNLYCEYEKPQGYICCSNCGAEGPCHGLSADETERLAWNHRALKQRNVSQTSYPMMKRYLQSLAHHPGLFYASFLTAMGAVSGAQRGSANAVVVGAAVMSVFWIPVLVTAAQHDYGQNS